MPLYEYQCRKCGHRFEKIQKFSDPLVKKCPECGGVVEQMISAPAVQFKGTGWYVTDYPRKGSGPSSSNSDGDGASAPKKDSKDSEDKSAKAEVKTEAKSKSDSKKPAKK